MTHHESGALLPCPFCGELPKLTHDWSGTAIWCKNEQCIAWPGASGGKKFNDTGHWHSAIEAWNRRRALPAAPMAEEVRLRQALVYVRELLRVSGMAGQQWCTDAARKINEVLGD